MSDSIMQVQKTIKNAIAAAGRAQATQMEYGQKYMRETARTAAAMSDDLPAHIDSLVGCATVTDLFDNVMAFQDQVESRLTESAEQSFETWQALQEELTSIFEGIVQAETAAPAKPAAKARTAKAKAAA